MFLKPLAIAVDDGPMAAAQFTTEPETPLEQQAPAEAIGNTAPVGHPFLGGGRADRASYLTLHLFCLVGGLYLIRLLESGTDVFIIVLIYAVIAWLSITTSIRRLHDLGKPGYYLFLTPVPFVGLALGLYLLFGRGNRGPNKYGR